MPLTQQQKDDTKAEFKQLTDLARKFARGSVEDLYVIDGEDLIAGGEALADLARKLPRATWVRGKQGHG